MTQVTFGRAGLAAALRDKDYEAKRSKPLWQALVALAIGAALAFGSARSFMLWFDGGALPGPRAFLLGAFGLMLFVLGLLALMSALCGLPRLAVTREGIELETFFGAKWANWEALSLFEPNRRMSALRCRIVGPGVSASLRRRSKLIIPDAFLTPLDAILADLHARQAPRHGIAPSPAAVEAAAPPRYGVANFGAPWLASSILLILAAIFTAEQLYAIEPVGTGLQPSLGTLIALGALNDALVTANGEWYRLFTAPLLHADLLHIVSNGIALLIGGLLLEKQVGRLWFLSFFVIGALGGALFSFAASSGASSVGASGAITGLFGAAYLSSFRLPAGSRPRWRTQISSVLLLLLAIIPQAASGSGGAIVDYGAHLGGALSGGVAAWLLFRAWPEGAPLPEARGWAAGIACLGVILAGIGGLEVAGNYQRYTNLAGLIPPSEQPRSEADGKARGGMLAIRYPNDPRGHMYRGANLIAARDEVAAEHELRTALQEAEDMRFLFGPRFEMVTRAMLTAVLFDNGKRDEAKAMAHPLCQAQSDGTLPASLRKLLVDGHFCEG